MKPGAIEIQKLVAVVILSMGIAYSCGRARADETGSGVPASPAVVPAKAGVILVRAITRGGVRPGEVLMVTGSGGLERVGGLCGIQGQPEHLVSRGWFQTGVC